MSLHKRKALRQRSGYLPLSGSVVESDPTPTASLLAQNSAAVPNPNSTPAGIPLVGSSASSSSATPAQQPSASTTGTTSPPSSDKQISLATVIGACIAAVVLLLLAVLLAFYCSRRQKQFTAHSKSRNAANNFSRRCSHLEPWKRMDDGDGDRAERRERSMKQRPPSGPLGGMFHRTISNASGEKSSEGHQRESIGSMQHFVKYHPGLAAEMASQGDIASADGKVARPPPAHVAGRGSDMAPPMSWGEETVGGESLMSLPSSRSPLIAKATPRATTTSLHRWESAEVVHVPETGSEYSEAGELQNPFSDSASSVKSSARGQNPFFSARDHPVKRSLRSGKPQDPFADVHSPPDSAAAIQSLIAALESPVDGDRIVSVQSSVYSRMTGDDGDSAINVNAFPYPPTRINVS